MYLEPQGQRHHGTILNYSWMAVTLIRGAPILYSSHRARSWGRSMIQHQDGTIRLARQCIKIVAMRYDPSTSAMWRAVPLQMMEDWSKYAFSGLKVDAEVCLAPRNSNHRITMDLCRSTYILISEMSQTTDFTLGYQALVWPKTTRRPDAMIGS